MSTNEVVGSEERLDGYAAPLYSSAGQDGHVR